MKRAYDAVNILIKRTWMVGECETEGSGRRRVIELGNSAALLKLDDGAACLMEGSRAPE